MMASQLRFQFLIMIVTNFNNPITKLLKDHRINPIETNSISDNSKDSVSIFRVEAFTLSGINSSQHFANSFSNSLVNIFQKSFLLVLTHSNFKFTICGSRTICLKNTPRSGIRNRIMPRAQHHHSMLEVSNSRFESSLPPIVIQSGSLVLVVRKQVKPNHGVKFVTKMIKQSIHDIQKLITPSVRDEYCCFFTKCFVLNMVE
mmetsp:Transcript_6749/g.11105  ORF Transcript_6749/g.11105 Transcript_6749/m.11105 type:complete len:202 (+) Transcript_6749:70-675(+)